MQEHWEDESRGLEQLTLRMTGRFLSIPGYALLVYCTTIMHCEPGSSHTSVSHDAVLLCWVTYTTSQMCPLDNGKGQTHTHTQSLITWPLTFQTHHQMPQSPSMLCVLLRHLSAVTDRMTGGRCYESCLGWWPHSWVPPTPHLGTPPASHASQTWALMKETERER